MTHIDYTESPYFFTMADIFIDWTPEHHRSPMAYEWLPAVEQNNTKPVSRFSLFDLVDKAKIHRKRMKKGYYERP